MPWSYSSLTQYESCNYKRKLVLDGHKEPPNEHTSRGTDVHKQAETYLMSVECPVWTGWGELDAPMQQLHSLFKCVEEMWGFTSEWKSCDPYAKDCWLRVKMDVVCFNQDPIRVIDFKTGKHYLDKAVSHGAQAQLYVVAAAANLAEDYPDSSYRAEFWYIDHEDIHKFPIMSAAQTLKFRPMWEKRANKMLEDTQFTPTPSKSKCKWCGLKQYCEYNVEEI